MNVSELIKKYSNELENLEINYIMYNKIGLDYISDDQYAISLIEKLIFLIDFHKIKSKTPNIVLKLESKNIKELIIIHTKIVYIFNFQDLSIFNLEKLKDNHYMFLKLNYIIHGKNKIFYRNLNYFIGLISIFLFFMYSYYKLVRY